MAISDREIGGRVEKQWVNIVTVDPRTRRIEGLLKDYGIVQINVWEVPGGFRWPIEGEWWLIVRENGNWFLRAPRQNDKEDSLKIENLDPGDTLIGVEGSKIVIEGDLVKEDGFPPWVDNGPVNVKYWGAKGDGITDDTAAIQAAIDALRLVGGGVLYFPSGIYMVFSSIQLTSNLTFWGEGMDASIILQASTMSGHTFIDRGISTTFETTDGLTAEDITFKGNREDPGTTPGGANFWTWGGSRWTFRRVRLCWSDTYGIASQSYPRHTDPLKRSALTDLRMYECVIDNNWEGCDFKYAVRPFMKDCLVYDNAFRGVDLRPVDGYLENVQSYDNGGDAIALRSNASGIASLSCKLVGCLGLRTSGTNLGGGSYGAGIAVRGGGDATTPAEMRFEFIDCEGVDNGHDGLVVGLTPGGTEANTTTTIIVRGGRYSENTLKGIDLEYDVVSCKLFGPDCLSNGSHGAELRSKAESQIVIGAGARFNLNGGDGLLVADTTTARVLGDNFQCRSNVGTGLHTSGSGGVSRWTTGIVNSNGTNFSLHQNDRLVNITSNDSTTVASAGTLTLPRHNDFIVVSGSTTITNITASHDSRRVTLRFSSTAQVTDGGNLLLAGDFTGVASRILELVCDGTNWIEISRSTN